MTIKDILSSSSKPFLSLEIVPPLKGMGRAELLDSIRPFMQFSPKYINVTCHRDEYEFSPNEDGSFSKKLVRNRVSEVAVAAAIKAEYEVEVVPHMICAGTTKEDIDRELESLKYLGIENVMALRGDCLSSEKRFVPTPGGYSHASELIEDIKLHHSDFCIGAGAYPEKHFEAPNLETDIMYLKRKVDAGADYVITQMFFDNKTFYRFRDLCTEAGIKVPIIPGLKPLTTKKQLNMLPEAFSIDIPVELSKAVSKAKDNEEAMLIGREWCISQVKDLLNNNVPAVHFYTMGKAQNISEILRNCF